MTEEMKKIQEEARRRFPIGCKFKDPSDPKKGNWRTLTKDDHTYENRAHNRIFANSGNGCLYIDGVWATIFNEESESTEPQYEIY